VIGSNTSPIPIAELAGKVQHAGRVVGIHFFSPVPAMKLMEIVVALDTAPETVEVPYRYADKLGKHPIKTKDRSGFIVNFLLIGQLMAATGCSRRASPPGRTSTTACGSVPDTP
jgi:3-hydroxybutyryl-CoA dehydrogenase